MKLSAAAVFLLAFLFAAPLFAQSPGGHGDSAQLDSILKKLDEQNAKIDALSQQILKLQEQLLKPGVPIGEATPAPGAPAPVTTAQTPLPAGPTHEVTRGETLTSIAKQYHVGVEELQRYNHIENDRKLQIGQTLAIPGTSGASPAPSATVSPNE